MMKNATREAFLALTMLAVVVTGAPTANAHDVSINKMYGVHADAIAVFTKHKLNRTNKVRKHFHMWSSKRLERFAKKNKLEFTDLMLAIHMSELAFARSINPLEAYLAVAGCGVRGLVQLQKQPSNALHACLRAANDQKQLLKAAPALTEIKKWQHEAGTIDAPKTASAELRSIDVHEIRPQSVDVLKALTKKKLLTNLDVFYAFPHRKDRARFVKRHKLNPEALALYVATADLLRFRAITPVMAHMLHAAGIESLVQLKSAQGVVLTPAVNTARERLNVGGKDVTKDQIETLIKGARPYRQR